MGSSSCLNKASLKKGLRYNQGPAQKWPLQKEKDLSSKYSTAKLVQTGIDNKNNFSTFTICLALDHFNF
jgi:hypothetical protein